MVGYNPGKTKMLVGQWRLDLVGLERKLQHELDEGPQIPSPENGRRHSRHHPGVNRQRFNKSVDGETSPASSSERGDAGGTLALKKTRSEQRTTETLRVTAAEKKG